MLRCSDVRFRVASHGVLRRSISAKARALLLSYPLDAARSLGCVSRAVPERRPSGGWAREPRESGARASCERCASGAPEMRRIGAKTQVGARGSHQPRLPFRSCAVWWMVWCDAARPSCRLGGASFTEGRSGARVALWAKGLDGSEMVARSPSGASPYSASPGSASLRSGLGAGIVSHAPWLLSTSHPCEACRQEFSSALSGPWLRSARRAGARARSGKALTSAAESLAPFWTGWGSWPHGFRRLRG